MALLKLYLYLLKINLKNREFVFERKGIKKQSKIVVKQK